MLNKSLPNFLGPRSFVQTMVPGLLRIVHVTVSRILLVSSHVQQCPIISAIATVTSVAATTAVRRWQRASEHVTPFRQGKRWSEWTTSLPTYACDWSFFVPGCVILLKY